MSSFVTACRNGFHNLYNYIPSYQETKAATGRKFTVILTSTKNFIQTTVNPFMKRAEEIGIMALLVIASFFTYTAHAAIFVLGVGLAIIEPKGMSYINKRIVDTFKNMAAKKQYVRFIPVCFIALTGMQMTTTFGAFCLGGYWGSLLDSDAPADAVPEVKPDQARPGQPQANPPGQEAPQQRQVPPPPPEVAAQAAAPAVPAAPQTIDVATMQPHPATNPPINLQLGCSYTLQFNVPAAVSA